MQAGDSNQRQVICNFSQFNVFFLSFFFFFYNFFYSFYSTKHFLINTLQILFRAIFILMYTLKGISHDTCQECYKNISLKQKKKKNTLNNYQIILKAVIKG